MYVFIRKMKKIDIFKVCARKFDFEAQPLTNVVDKMPDNFLATFLDYANQVTFKFYLKGY